MGFKSKIVGNIGFAILAQGLMGVMQVVLGFVLPKEMGTEQYGYYQEYAYYAMYLNFFGLGINDGLALNYAGKEKTQVPTEKIRGAIRVEVVGLLMPTILLVIVGVILLNRNKWYIIIMLASSIIPTVLWCVENGLLLMENKSVWYNISNVLNKGLLCLTIVCILLFKLHNSYNIIMASVIVTWIMAIAIMPICKKFFFGPKVHWKSGIEECKKLSKSGSLIMLSILFMGLIPTIGRIVIEYNEPIQVYGVFSFYIGLMNVILAFTNAIGIIAFPMMRNIKSEKLESGYKKVELIYSFLGAGAFLVYPIILLIVEYIMPDYISGIEYFPFLFAACYPLGKIQMLLVPYLKTKRKERDIFRINFTALLFSAIMAFGAYYMFESVLTVAIATIISVMVYYYMTQRIMVQSEKENDSYSVNRIIQSIDFVTPIVFIAIAELCDFWWFVGLYLLYLIVVALVFYLQKKRNKCTYKI